MLVLRSFKSFDFSENSARSSFQSFFVKCTKKGFPFRSGLEVHVSIFPTKKIKILNQDNIHQTSTTSLSTCKFSFLKTLNARTAALPINIEAKKNGAPANLNGALS